MEENVNYTNEGESKGNGKKQKISIFQILGGGILKEDFVVKQSKLLLLIAFLSIILISNRYSCLQKLSKIEDLKRELADIKYENLVISSELTSNSRQSQIEELLNKKGINLGASKNPAYEISK